MICFCDSVYSKLDRSGGLKRKTEAPRSPLLECAGLTSLAGATVPRLLAKVTRHKLHKNRNQPKTISRGNGNVEFPARPDLPDTALIDPHSPGICAYACPTRTVGCAEDARQVGSQRQRSPGLLGSLLLCYPMVDSKSKPENPGGPWSNGKGKGLARKARAGITSCRVLYAGYLVLGIWARGVRVLFCHKRRICGSVTHRRYSPDFLVPTTVGVGGGVLALAIPARFTLVPGFHFLRPSCHLVSPSPFRSRIASRVISTI